VLKALAFDSCGENKDAYDLFYILRSYGAGVENVIARLQLDDEEADRALDVLCRDFTDPESVGPMRVAEFIMGGPDEAIQADVVGFVATLLRRCA
jgi:hypothetical protein